MKKYQEPRLCLVWLPDEDTLVQSNFGDGIEFDQTDFFTENG